MKFKKYSSLRSSADTQKVKHLLWEGWGSTPCVVQEKIHGANFSLWCDGKRVRAARRLGWLKPKHEFFGFQEVVKRHRDALFALHKAFQEECGAKVVVVFGELCGGAYPHPDVSQVEGRKAVQKGIAYAPDLQFLVFDVVVDGRFCSVVDGRERIEALGLHYVPMLFEGTLQECLAQPFVSSTHASHSLVPAMFGLPPIQGNLWEGVVIRSATACEPADTQRILLKCKHEAWMERDEHAALARHRKKPRTQIQKLSKQAEALWCELSAMVCENRLVAVTSKYLPSSLRVDAWRTSALLYDDVMRSMTQAQEQVWDSLSVGEQEVLSQRLRDESKDFCASSSYES